MYIPSLTPRATLEEIYYFSALAFHRQDKDPGIIARHELLIECLRATGVKVGWVDSRRKTYIAMAVKEL